ncbi:hypothetical protein LI291_15350, partial [Intestinibacillus massiliensis]|nr:hypothetical protein [Intestinibacillus massiliensis]
MLEEDAVKILERSESIDLSREEDLVDKLDECIAALKEFGEKRSLFYKRPLVTYKELTNDQVLFDTMKTCDHIEGIVKERNRYQKELTKAEFERASFVSWESLDAEIGDFRTQRTKLLCYVLPAPRDLEEVEAAAGEKELD